MKDFFKLRTILCWIICVGAYWVSALLYPYNFYYQETYAPNMTFVQLLILIGITALLGTGMHLIMYFIGLVGKYIGMKKNLALYFLYHFVLCGAYAFATDYFLDIIKIEPFWLYLLLGFFPATLCSIVYSYHRSHRRLERKKTEAKQES